MSNVTTRIIAAFVAAIVCVAAHAQQATVSGFKPNGSYQLLSATGTSAAVALPSGQSVVIYNNGSAAVTVRLGSSLITATAGSGDMVQPGGWIELTVGNNTYLAGVTAGTTVPLVLSGGSGLAAGVAPGSGGGSGGGGAVFGPTAVGNPAANPPILVGGTVDGTATGNVGVAKVLGGNVYVQCANCSGSGASGTDEGTFAPSTSIFAPGGGFFQTTPTNNALLNLQWGAWQLTANRAGFVNLRNASGSEIGTSTTPVQVSVANTGANATPILVTGTGGTFPATQSGVWNITNISGTISLPTGAATAAGLTTINTTLGSPFQAGGSIGNTAFGISGTLPAFAATPTFNLGTLNGAATAANQTNVQSAPGSSASTAMGVQGVTGGVPLSITGTVTANAGNNLNTSALALETGGNLATTATNTGTTATNVTTTNTNVGAPGATACVTDNGSCSLNALLQRNNQRLTSLITAVGSPFQAGGLIGNTAFGISGTLPAFAATPTFKIDQSTPGTTNAVQIAGTLPAFASAPTVNLGTLNGAALASGQPSNLAVGALTSGSTGNIGFGAATTAAPTYTTGQAYPLSLTTAGALRVDGSGATQPVSQTTAANLNATVVGTGTFGVQCSNCLGSGVDEGTFTAGSSAFAPSGGFFQTTATSNPLANGQGGWWQMTANRAGFVNLRNASGVEIGIAAAPLQVSLGNTGANATAILVTGTGGIFPATQSGAWSVTANAGTNLNTSLLALESGGNLATTATNTGTTNTDIGPPGATACATDTGSCSINALSQRLAQRLTSIVTALGSPFQAGGSIGNTAFTATSSGAVTNPTSTLTLTATTTAYTAGQLIANSATAGSVVVPSFAIANSAGGAIIPRLRLTTNDTTSTAWGSQQIRIDLWSAAPTFTNGDRGTWSPATGVAGHIASYTCTMSAEFGDGAYSECTLIYGNNALAKLASGTSIFWTLNALTGSGVTGASKVFTLTAELLN